MARLSEHFDGKEFACRCCGVVKIDPMLVAKLECLRASIGNRPIFVNSGYRCPKHNKSVGGAEKSLHMQGKAADIRVSLDMAELGKMSDRIFKVGGMGIYKTFIHVDTGPTRRWLS